MQVVTFKNPTDIGAYEAWQFEVLESTISLHIEDLRDVYASYVDSWRDIVARMDPSFGRVAEFHRVEELLASLNAAIAAESDIELDGHDYVWSFCSGLMFDRRFVAVWCSGCNQRFEAFQTRVERWSYGRGLAAEGGRRVVCPSGHTLYACGEWNS